MDYEKKLALAKEALESGSYDRETIEYIFPELKEKESEGERIRKELIDFLEYYRLNNVLDSKTIFLLTDSVAWLEKQGKKESQGKSALEVWEEMRLEVYAQASGNRHEPNHSDDSTKMFSLTDIDEIFEKIAETQNEYTDPCRTCDHQTMSCINFPCEKNQGEQKFTDKVEQKFKVGDWITNGDYTWKIVEVKPLDYILQSQDGNIVDDTISHVDERFHFFTIEDAKDGDILVSSKSIFIFQKEYITGEPLAYCGLINTQFIKSFDGCWTNEKCYPATKEQRDFLFMKMKEEGYEWNPEKKELKKIEQRSTWSEEDERNLDGIIDEIEANKNSAPDCDLATYNRFLSWLKSIKGRVQPKPAWSKDDESYLNTTIAYLKDAKEFKKTAENCINWLKSLRPQPHWKPSDEQMETLFIYAEQNNKDGYILNALYQQLKKLKEEQEL